MVQRKVTSKLGIQADHHKTEKWLGNLKPSYSCQYQDGKNRGPDMKKKMKKSRSIKLSDIESLRSTPLRKNISQPGKPPTLNVPTPEATSQKQSVIKTTDGSPNYMKATSSSEAKKESLQGSSRNTQIGSDSKIQYRRNSSGSKLSSASGNKPARTLTKTSSLKMVRTLTKTPSFKPARASAKKCSGVALCADMNTQKATCSSTLKDSKFPAYVMLNPGGTEAEGTSVMKVCPYNYCSLNGHCHGPLPPLKSFLSARRRSLRTQRSMKLEALISRKAKPSGHGIKDIDIEQMIFDDKPAYNEVDLGKSPTSPLIQEKGVDFFTEIYAKNKEDEVEANGGSTRKDCNETVDFAGECENQNKSSFGGDDEATIENNMDKQVAERLSDGSLHSDIDFEESFEHYNDIFSIELDSRESFPREHKVQDPEEDYPPILAQGEATPKSFYSRSGFEGECQTMEKDDFVYEAADMEWKEGQLSASETDNSVQTDDELDLIVGCLSESNSGVSVEIVTDYSKEILVDEVSQNVFEEESPCYITQSDDSDSETDGTRQNSKIVEPSQISDTSNSNRVSSTDYAVEEMTPAFEKGQETEMGLISNVITSTSASEKIEQNGAPEAENNTYEMDPQLGDAENNYSTKEIADADIAEVNHSSKDVFDESLPDQAQDHASDGQSGTTTVENHSFLEKDQDEAQKLKIQRSMDTESDSRMYGVSLAENSMNEVDEMEVEGKTESGTAETFPTAIDKTSPTFESIFSYSGSYNQELPNTCNRQKWTIRRKTPIEDSEESRKFNPREPNYLPVIPEPDAEKVDLRHQEMDERKNTKEWMLDYALQQAVTKLAPARKRKVALLIEAFETVAPIPKWEARARHTSTPFAHGRPIQACS